MEWTSIPVKLKILKLFIRELSNITEGEENNSGPDDQQSLETSNDGWETIDNDADGGWESDESDEEWEDDDVTKGTDAYVEDTQEDLLKGVNTKVWLPLSFVIRLNCRADDRILLWSF